MRAKIEKRVVSCRARLSRKGVFPLTKHDRDSDRPGQAGARVATTQEMIEAGKQVFWPAEIQDRYDLGDVLIRTCLATAKLDRSRPSD